MDKETGHGEVKNISGNSDATSDVPPATLTKCHGKIRDKPLVLTLIILIMAVDVVIGLILPNTFYIGVVGAILSVVGFLLGFYGRVCYTEIDSR